MKLKNSVIFLFRDLPETVLEYSQPPRTKKKKIRMISFILNKTHFLLIQ